MNYLFVGGCPRSGTTALMELLNVHPAIALGKERFKQVKKLDPGQFERDHFLRPTRQETNIMAPDHYAELRRKLEGGGVSYLGDKTPGYYRRLPDLAKRFPTARFLMIWRDPVRVASSFEFRVRRAGGGWSPVHDYRNALVQWNTSLKRIREFVGTEPGKRLMLIHYDWFFSGDVTYLRAVFHFLGLQISETVAHAYLLAVRKWNRVRQKELHLDDAQIAYALKERDGRAQSWASAFAATQICRHLSPELPQADSVEARIVKQFHRFTDINRLEQLTALGAYLEQLTALGEYRDGGARMSHQQVLAELDALVSRVSDIESRSKSILEQIKTAEDSAWSRLGANLDRVRKPASRKAAERSISQQTSEMRRKLAGYRKAIEKFSEKLHQ